MQNLVDRVYISVRRGVQYNDDRSDQAYGTANFAQQAKVLSEKVGAQYSSDVGLAIIGKDVWNSTYPMRTESAPRGVTRIAGANAYAAKLKISPTTTTHC